MKKLWAILFIAMPASAAFQSVEQPIVYFNASNVPVKVSVCAVDSAVGNVCSFVMSDANGAPLSINAQGDLLNKAAVVQALKAALIAQRDAFVVERAQKNAMAVARKKVALTPPTVAGQ